MTTKSGSQRVIESPDVAAAFSSYDDDVRPALLGLRQLILDTAEETAGVGHVDEVLRWGQPSYVTTQTRNGSTIRIAPTRPESGHDYAMFFTCHTNLVQSFKPLFGDALSCNANRGLMFTVGTRLPEPELRVCIATALTYHLVKR